MKEYLLFRDCAKRNYELEELLYSQKMKPAKENLLRPTDEEASKGYQIDRLKFEPKIELIEDEEEEGGIADKAKQVSLYKVFIFIVRCSG